MNVQELLSQAQSFFNSGAYPAAAASLLKVVTLEPMHETAHINLSYLSFLSGDLKTALSSGNTAVNISPENADAHLNYGNALRAHNDVAKAIEHLEKSLQLRPEFAEAWSNLNLALLDANRVKEAIYAGKKAVQYGPELVNGYCNLALAYQQIGEIKEADALLKKALQINPSASFLHDNLLMNMQYLPAVSSAVMKGAAQNFGEMVYPDNNAQHKCNVEQKNDDPLPHRALRVGYVSGDFRKHPVGWFMRAIISRHNPTKIISYVYASQQVEDDVSKQIKSDCDHWIDILQFPDAEVAEIIRAHKIDILVDLSGHTGGNRLGVFAHQAAPIQVSWLGYFASTGVKEIDYVLLGEEQAPNGCESYFTEYLYRLKGDQFCYSAPEYAPEVKAPPSHKTGYITFGSFNNPAKLNSDVIRLWATIIDQVDNSRLVLKWGVFKDPSMCQLFLDKFVRLGISAERIELRGASPHAEMLAEYSDIDIALDPFPFSGALTTCEALWMGVPVVTYPHLRPVSRQTHGILLSLGLKQLSASTPAEYIKIATALATSPNRLKELNGSLRSRMKNSSLMDGTLKAEALEDAFSDIHQRHPAHLER